MSKTIKPEVTEFTNTPVAKDSATSRSFAEILNNKAKETKMKRKTTNGKKRNGVAKPRMGTMASLIWSRADALQIENPDRLVTVKDVADSLEELGESLNLNTVNSQLYKYRKHHAEVEKEVIKEIAETFEPCNKAAANDEAIEFIEKLESSEIDVEQDKYFDMYVEFVKFRKHMQANEL